MMSDNSKAIEMLTDITKILKAIEKDNQSKIAANILKLDVHLEQFKNIVIRNNKMGLYDE
jgi:hypothetical protein